MNLAPYRKKSPWILHYNAGGCNGCDIEILACLGPKYDIERFGMINTGNPKQSDILLVTGPVTKRSRERLLEVYAQMPEPKVVVSCGACACTGGVFRGMYNSAGFRTMTEVIRQPGLVARSAALLPQHVPGPGLQRAEAGSGGGRLSAMAVESQGRAPNGL